MRRFILLSVIFNFKTWYNYQVTAIDLLIKFTINKLEKFLSLIKI